MLKSLLQKNPKLDQLYFKTVKRSKGFFQLLFGNGQNKTIFFIIGCQRSGTTLMSRIFEKDWNSKVYNEFSVLSSTDKSTIRLKPLQIVKEAIDHDKASLVILKPLVETQNALKLLDYFPNSRAIWLFRDYRDVASSNLKKFGEDNGKNNLRPIVENLENNWRSESVSDEVRNIVLDHFSEDMSQFDAAALFWYVRNKLFYELNLDDHPNVFMCRYDHLVSEADEVLKKMYDFSGQKFPGEVIVSEVKKSSVGKGKDIPLSPSIHQLCSNLMEELNRSYENKKESALNWEVI